MKQPKFEFGERVNFSTEVRFVDNTLIVEKVIRQGEVCGIHYDPKKLADKSPYYFYSIRYGSSIFSNVRELDMGRAKDE